MASKAVSRRRTTAFKTIAVGLLTVILVTFYKTRHPALLEFLTLRASDLRIYYLRGTARPTGDVVVAAVDDKSIAELGRWPWPRGVEARLVSALRDYHVAVIGFDILFSERDSNDAEREKLLNQLAATGLGGRTARELFAANNDDAFADAIKAQGSTYLGYAFNSHRIEESGQVDLSGYSRQMLRPPPLAYNLIIRTSGASDRMLLKARAYLPPVSVLNQAAAGVAYVDIDADSDGLMRSYPTVVDFKGRYCVPLFLAVVDAAANHAPLSLQLGPAGVRRIAIGNVPIPVDELGHMMIHFRGRAGTIPHYSVADIINHRVAPGKLRGRIVFVGVTGHALGDRFVTPVGGDFPGVEIQATAADTVLRGDIIHRSAALEVIGEWIGIALGVTITMAGAFISAIASFVLAIMLAAGFFLVASYWLYHYQILIGVVFPLIILVATYLAVVSYRYVTEGLEKRHLRLAFEHYLNPDVIASVVDNPAGLRLGGERRHLSILFSDIVNFTARAERSEPEPLVALLNTYMTAMINVIFETRGVVDKLMGDGIMAFWGAPVSVQNPARQAVECALRMLEELERLRQHDERFKDLDIGIGIATGEAVVGNFGGDRHFDYSVIGDTVNLASRIEGLTRQFKVPILVNRTTLAEAGDSYVAREIGLVKVKGKDQLVPVAEIVGRSADGIDPAYYRRFSQALERIRAGDSAAALRELLRERPSDQVVAMCLERLDSVNQSREIVFEFDTK
ncbi:MAG: CHASE2 domain-containing protein [Candidatus Binataceae bacterium]